MRKPSPIPRAAAAAVALVLLLLAPRWASSRGLTTEEGALDSWLSRRAPLALSGDGRWRLHVDPAGVLHRVPLAGAQPALRLQLPAGLQPRALAASADGLRVAVLGSTGCVAVADFGAGAAGREAITWMLGGLPYPSPAGQGPGTIAGAPPDAQCRDDSGRLLAVALSSDGRLLATPHAVFDIDARKTVATLPRSVEGIGSRQTFGVQFVDERRLLTASATLGEGYESPSSPSELQFALWDLQTGALLRLVVLPADWLFLSPMFFHQLAPAQGPLAWVDGRRHLAAHRSGREGAAAQAPLDLMQLGLTDCSAAPRRLLELAPHEWTSLVLDPAGRWLAGVQEVPDPSRGPTAVAEKLWILETTQGRVLKKLPLRERIGGLLALPDGSGLLALRQGLPRGGELRRFDVDVSGLPAARPAASAAAALQQACRLEDETAQARSVRLDGPVLASLWSLALKRGQPDPDGPRSFLYAGRRLGVDQGDEIVQVDPLSGRPLARWPTPRSALVHSVAVPEAGGFVNHQGDTLSWRPFEPGTAPRRVIEVRPGWAVESVQRIGGVLLVKWHRAAPAGAGSAPPRNDVRYATHDPATLKRLHERELPAEEDRDDILEELLPAAMPAPPCSAPALRAAGGLDWRVSHFDSFRAWDCTAGAARTVFWSHLDALPKAPLWGAVEPIEVRRRTGPVDGRWAVAMEGSRVQVFDIAGRRELGHVDLPPRQAILGVHLLAEEGVLMVQLFDSDEPGASGHLRAFAIKAAR